MKFNFFSDDQSEEMNDILYCLRNILSIPEGSIPLSRGLGLDWNNISTVAEDLENDYATDIMEKVEEFEPRVEVTEVEFKHDSDGETNVNITIELADTDEGEEDNDDEFDYEDEEDEEDEE
jgi:phage baseplate assembly protein W